MQPMRQALLLSLLLLGPWLSGSAAALAPPKGVIPQDGHPAPPIKLSDLDGNVGDLNRMQGKWVFVHFWASWCGPCRRELPRLQALPQHLDPQHFAMLLVNTAEDEDTVFTFLAGVAPDLQTLLDRDGLATEAWGPRGLPATYLLDPDGRVRYQALGGRPWDEPNYLNFLKAVIAGH